MRASRIAALNFFADLTSTYARRRFFCGFIFLIFCCLGLVHINSGLTIDIIVSILIEIIAGAAIILAFYALYIYFIGDTIGDSEVGVLRPQDIRGKIRALPLDTRSYMFWGRSGSFFRAYPLLKLDKQARKNKHNIRIEVLLPDPGESRLVNAYRDILKSLGEDDSENPLLPNVIATCMACAIVAANNKHLEIRVRLSRFLPGFRLDLSDNGAVLTQDDKKKSAMFFASRSEFYEMFRSTMLSECEVSREVNWNNNAFHGLNLKKKSCNEVTLNAFGIEVSEPEKIQREVARLINSRPHRYK